jgi:hypothetical protein
MTTETIVVTASNYIVTNTQAATLAVVDANGNLQQISQFLTATLLLTSTTAADLTALLGSGNVVLTNTVLGTIVVSKVGGPTITSGTGVPSGVQPNGSIYLNTTGGSGTRLYFSHGAGTWVALAGS